MGSETLLQRLNGQTINATWFNQLRSALMQDQYPRNSSGVATDQAGSLGSSSERFLNAYLMNLYLMSGSNYVKVKAPAGLAVNYDMQLPAALPGAGLTLPLQITDGGILTFAQIPTGGIVNSAVTTAKIADLNVTQAKLQARATGTSVAAGGFATSAPITQAYGSTAVSSAFGAITVVSTGRPVRIGLMSGGSGSYIGSGSAVASNGLSRFYIYKNNVFLVSHDIDCNPSVTASSTAVFLPPGVIDYHDITAAGTHTYDIRLSVGTAGITAYLTNVILFSCET